MLGERQRSTESHPGQSECAGMGGWVDNVIRAERKSERRGINVIKTVVSISTLGPCFKKQTQNPGRKSPLLSSKTTGREWMKFRENTSWSFPSVYTIFAH